MNVGSAFGEIEAEKALGTTQVEHVERPTQQRPQVVMNANNVFQPIRTGA